MTAITTPIAAQSIHEGKNEPITLICGPMASPLSIRSRTVTGAERQRRRGLQELDLRVQLHEPGTTQLAAGAEEIGEGPESLTVRRQRVVVRLLRRLQQGGSDVEAPVRELDDDVCFPNLVDRALARRCDLAFGRSHG